MAQHNVTFTIPERSLGKADVEFKIKRNSRQLGRLKISNGAIVWVQKNAKYGYKLGWKDFDNLMKNNGKSERKG